MTQVSAGGKDAERLRLRMSARDLRLIAGTATETRFLNGSREERKDGRAFWLSRASELSVPARAIGCMVVMGGAHQRGRGRRYLRIREPGITTLTWVDWRRAKRLVRRGEADHG